MCIYRQCQLGPFHRVFLCTSSTRTALAVNLDGGANYGNGYRSKNGNKPPIGAAEARYQVAGRIKTSCEFSAYFIQPFGSHFLTPVLHPFLP